MKKRIALKIDVDTYHGLQAGVTPLVELLKEENANGAFFFALGPDRSGCEKKKLSLKRYYNFKTRLNGRFVPAPDIGKHHKQIMQSVKEAGFELGIHAWDRAFWEMRIEEAENTWVEQEMAKAHHRFEEIFGAPARSHAASGWRTRRHALRLTQRLGYTYASDCRGEHPFLPVIDGEIVMCPQIPTTLPTFDEIQTLEPTLSAEEVFGRIFQLSTAIAGDHVLTVRAEIEGIRVLEAFKGLLKKWKEADYQIVVPSALIAETKITELPRHRIVFEEISGRSGWRTIQGEAFP